MLFLDFFATWHPLGVIQSPGARTFPRFLGRGPGRTTLEAGPHFILMNPFPSTHGTRLEQERDLPEGREWFCAVYRPALLGYLRPKMDYHEAEDLCQ